MKNVIAIRREDLSKKGEKRVALVPGLVKRIVKEGHPVLVQPAVHPVTGEVKRAFSDEKFRKSGAEITEDISAARVVFGLKEVGIDYLLPGKAWYFFSHTHKGQLKNRKLLRKLVELRSTVIDFELITDADDRRLITAFTYFAGYAGMIDSLWAFGKRLALKGIAHPLAGIPQSIEKEDLPLIRGIVEEVGEEIERKGTPEDLPPFICCFLGTGKTSTGAQEIFDLLPSREITIDQLPRIFANGSRKFVYKLVLEIPDMYKLKTGAKVDHAAYHQMSVWDQMGLYLREPEHFESNLEQVFPYCQLMMNCIIWSPKYPRLLTYSDVKKWYRKHKVLEVVGDISCDPEGGIQFSRETWIDNPVFVYEPEEGTFQFGFDHTEGIAVLAVTNLPCEFSIDASTEFSRDIAPLMQAAVSADYDAAEPGLSGLPDEVKKAVILWRGEFPPAYAYMAEYLKEG